MATIFDDQLKITISGPDHINKEPLARLVARMMFENGIPFQTEVVLQAGEIFLEGRDPSSCFPRGAVGLIVA